MGTKVQSESFSRALFSMRDLNEDSSSSSWPHFYNDKPPPFLPYNNGYTQTTLVDGHQDEHEKDALKQKMLEHEAVFKNQVCELHRLYQIQRNMMDEVKRKDVHSFRPSIEPASSSCLQAHNQIPGFYLMNSVNGRTSGEVVNSPMSCSKKEESEALNGRPLKVRKTFDLQLPADDYIDIEEGESSRDNNGGPENVPKKCFKGSTEMVDLNEPIQFDGASNFLDLTSENTESKGLPTKFVTADSFHLSNGRVHSLRQGPHMQESGYIRSIAGERSPFLSHLHRGTVNQIRGVLPSNYIKEEDRWREGLRPGLDSSNRNLDRLPNGHFPTVAYNNTSSSFPFLSSLPSPSVPSWVKLSNGFSHFNPIVEPLPQSQDMFARKMFGNSSSRLNTNGFYHGSASGSKHSRFNGVESNRSSNHGMKSAIAIDLNKEVPRSPSDEVVILDDADVSVRKNDYDNQNPASLPWLKSNPVPVNEIKSVNKIMGFSISGRENEPSSVASTSASDPNSGFRNKSRMIDINEACEPDEDMVTAEEPKQMKRDYIDLNACMDDCEDHTEPTSGRAKRRMLEIDLEAPPCFMECEEETKENDHIVEDDESLREAAGVIFAMSSSYLNPCEEEPSGDESLLLLFANAIIAESTSENGFKKMDEFESMTLQLEETRKEDYMPKLPIAIDVDEIGINASRARRGQTRRGRQRRDFQRDILPGLASLSRHEVTEDLQIYGGIMRGMGHSWNAGLTRRNGGGRGRKRAVVEFHPPLPPISTPLIQQLNNIEAGLEDRSLTTSWGKTTRRPRRQRYPQGNQSSVMLS